MSALIFPGTVFVVDTGSGWAEKAIKLGERLLGIDDKRNHVAVFDHYDSNGVPQGEEGRPGGVGPVDMRGYLSRGDTVSNWRQPIPDDARAMIAAEMPKLHGTEYDWFGIGGDACAALHLPVLFAQNWKGKGVPGHVVCSSYAAWLYNYAGLSHPVDGEGGLRFVEPGHWASWIQREGWK